MQFHLNSYKRGSSAAAPPGCCWRPAFDISGRPHALVERRSGPLGQADDVACRTVETFDE